MFDHFSLFDFVAWYLVFLFSTTAHEAAHAFAALKLGDDTAHRGGQVSLDPTPHITREPFGMVIVPIISYLMGGWMIGWASAPYDPEWARRFPKRSALMAMAGPLANLLLVLLAALLIHVGINLGFFEMPDSLRFMSMVSAKSDGIWNVAAVLLSLTFSLNFLLFIFNLLPVPPLDGSEIPLIFLPHTAAEKYSNFIHSPMLSFMGIFVAWQVFGSIFPPLQSVARHLLYPGHYL